MQLHSTLLSKRINDWIYLPGKGTFTRHCTIRSIFAVSNVFCTQFATPIIMPAWLPFYKPRLYLAGENNWWGHVLL